MLEVTEQTCSCAVVILSDRRDGFSPRLLLARSRRESKDPYIGRISSALLPAQGSFDCGSSATRTNLRSG